ncbi:hypothetical protein O4H49_16445 [Kiloniella laminariae]|uniref:Beta/gamma crystallin 'Greek key' domain-containing protein n=1 Tax=Kiloniella laminariae TaxID=454162 RepID=A0ABT4LMR5_9PROT|nr:hypothetical protein [Kiloniella laminariae]MCZ4282378.1 hypothetical protein [Kiloniella laminariae]
MRALRRIAGIVVAFVSGVGSLSGQALAQQAIQDPAANQVLAFDGADYSGAGKLFNLPDGQLYSFIPSLEDFSGKISSIKLGDQVGVILFREELFQTTDNSCAPIIGTREEPHLLWKGATADLLPPRPSSNIPLAMPVPQDNAYASMIIYRRDVGPPPGVLMLQRLNSYSRGCGNVLDQLNYRRVFIPAWDNGKTGYCQNLVGPTSYAGARSTFRFNDSDQLIFMHPESMDQGYRTVKHRVRSTLYDFPDCQGNHVTFPFKAESIHKFNLADYGYKGRARSVKVEYVSGPAAGISSLAVAAAPVTTQTVAPSVPQAVPSASASVKNPAVPQAAVQSQQAAVPAPSSAVVPQPATRSLAPATAPTTQTVTPVTTPSAAATPIAPPPAAYPDASGDLAAAGITAARDDALVPVPTIAPEAGVPQRQTIATEPENSLFTPSYQLFEGQPNTPVASEPLGTSGSSGQGTLPTEAAEQVAIRPAGGTPFEFPVFDAYRLNYCLTPGTNCGEAAATEWCSKKGFTKALAWVRDNNIGSLYPTMNMGSKTICSSYNCDGFKELTCGN